MATNSLTVPVVVTPVIARRLAVGFLLAVLLARAAIFGAAGLAAIRYPFELDYGEGIVWQQMRWIFTAKAYGPIDRFPAIVFHYTPFYHAVTSLASHALGTDELATGRAVSLLSTLAAAVASGVLVAMLLGERASRRDRRLCGGVAALLVFTYLPVTYWAPLMRVDMLALALSLGGLVAAFAALERPRLILLAALAFVAALYTKQTSIAAPAATFAILLAVRPKLAFQGIAASAALGLAVLAPLAWLTDGGFLRHVFVYNVNRADWARLSWIGYAGAMHILYFAVAGFVLVRRGANLRARYRGKGRSARASLAANTADIRLMIAIAYLAVTTLMLVLVAKSGSSINYFLEWFFALGLFVALGVHDTNVGHHKRSVGTALAVGIPLALALQALMTPRPDFAADPRGSHAHELAQLSGEIAAATKPVISDDMVLLLRSGREVLWEPSIFAELASTGAWDEGPFVKRVRAGQFAFFVTWGDRGDRRFDERYNPAVADAMAFAYPVEERRAGLIVHRPRPR